MKQIFLVLSLITGLLVRSQSSIDGYIKEAQTFLTQKNYKQAQLSLQDAMNEINNLLAKQIAEAIPSQIGDLKSVGEPEITNATMMGAGMQIMKTYKNAAKPEVSAEITILSNPSVIAGLTMFINNPSLMGQGQKSIRIGARRAIAKTEMEDRTDDKGITKQVRVTEIQIPLSQTMVTVKSIGLANEQEEQAFVSKIDLDKLKTLLGE